MADNTLLTDVHTLVDEVVSETDIAAGFSKMLPSFTMGDVDGQRYEDVEYLPEDFRFESEDGIESNPDNSDAQALTDRLIPIRRDKSKHIKVGIKTKQLRDPRLRKMAAAGFARELRNAIDKYCYDKAITRANMVTTASGLIKQSDCSAADMLMLDSGLGGYSNNIHLSIPHYKVLADGLASNDPVRPGLPQTAYEKSIIPNQIGGFSKASRADYRITLPAAEADGVTVTGSQSHTVITKDANDNYVDNRGMPLVVSDTSDIKAGDKFTLVGVGRLNPEVREDTGELMTFTVNSVTNGTTLNVSPAIIVDGPFRNCTAATTGGSAVTFLNAVKNNPTVYWAEDSIKLIPGNLPVEGGGVDTVEASTEQGLPIRFTYWYDPDAEKLFMKVVVFFDCEVWLPSQVGVLLDEQG
jgi:hypothetical protein